MRSYIARPVILGELTVGLFLAPVPHAQAEPALSPAAAAIIASDLKALCVLAKLP